MARNGLSLAASRNAWNVSTSQVCETFLAGVAVTQYRRDVWSALPRYSPLRRSLECGAATEDGPIAQAIVQHGCLEALDVPAGELL